MELRMMASRGPEVKRWEVLVDGEVVGELAKFHKDGNPNYRWWIVWRKTASGLRTVGTDGGFGKGRKEPWTRKEKALEALMTAVRALGTDRPSR